MLVSGVSADFTLALVWMMGYAGLHSSWQEERAGFFLEHHSPDML